MAALTGIWSGRYSYANFGAPVSFEARLDEAPDGTLSGTIIEPNTIRKGAGAEISARMIGARSGNSLRFIKYYRGFDQGDDPAYEGRINDDVTRIVGKWSFSEAPGWTGDFVMMRMKVRPEAARSTAVLRKAPVPDQVTGE